MEEIFSTILPPLFWPILMILIFLVAFYPGFLSPVVKGRRQKQDAHRAEIEKAKNAHRADVEEAYKWVSASYKPEALNPNQPGNPYANKERAQMAVDVLRPKLIQNPKHLIVPSRIDVDDDQSLYDWYEFLRNERTDSEA